MAGRRGRACTFLTVPKLTGVMAVIPSGTHVTFDIHATYIDHAARQVIDDWQQQHRATGGTVAVGPARTAQPDTDPGDPCNECGRT